VHLVGCWSWLVLVGAAGSASIDDQHEPASEAIKAFDRSCRPAWEGSAPPTALLEQPLEVLPGGKQERLAVHAPAPTEAEAAHAMPIFAIACLRQRAARPRPGACARPSHT
jgi:hypothetical protein